jgi:hypothetical protein
MNADRMEHICVLLCELNFVVHGRISAERSTSVVVLSCSGQLLDSTLLIQKFLVLIAAPCDCRVQTPSTQFHSKTGHFTISFLTFSFFTKRANKKEKLK